MTQRTFLYLRKKKFRLIEKDAHVFKMKKPVCCPICDAPITVTFTGWEWDDKWRCWIPDHICQIINGQPYLQQAFCCALGWVKKSNYANRKPC